MQRRNRDLITSLAARHRVPAVYPFRYFATAGGLLSYGIDSTDLFHRSASYVDLILKILSPLTFQSSSLPNSSW
jgi:putative tryptophan/tyrosine transport system substrate-binding protein